MVSTVSKDGTITTRFVEGYVYEDSSSVFWTRLMLSVVYPYWFILRPIIALIINRNEMRKKYPNEVIRAFNIAERKYPHVQISKKDARTNNRKMERYDKKIEKIEKKYSVLGKKIVEERKSEVSKPIKKLHIKGKEYIIHRHFMTKKYQDGYFLIGKKLSGKIFGLVLIDGCYVDNDIDNWTNTWNEISRRLSVDNVDYEKEADKIIDLYKHCL